MQAEQILIGCFVECQSIKKVDGRRSVEELYQALFFVSSFDSRLNVSQGYFPSAHWPWERGCKTMTPVRTTSAL